MAMPAVPVMAQEAEESPRVLLYEIRLGGTELTLEDGTKVREYVSLFNPTNTAVSLNQWRIEYAKSSFDKQYCHTASWRDHATSSVVSVFELGGSLDTKAVSAPIPRQLNDTGSGSMRIINGTIPAAPVVYDVVGWGPEAPCYEQESTITPVISSTSNRSLSRYIACEDNSPIDTDNNKNDFAIATSHPESLGTTYKQVCTVQEEPEEEQPPLAPPCDGAVISELLPNPDGTDTGNEFIELHNPTDKAIFLESCVLKTSANSKQYVFQFGSLLAPGEYKAFYDSLTDLSLANAAGGEVLLVGTSADFVVQYPADMKSGHSWSLVDNTWHDTTIITPNAGNQLPVPILESTESEDDELAACGPGRYRSPETNRCRNIQVATAAVPCDPGQVRNPDTNRCRSIVSLASSLIPCREGQERNPETNRCRTIESAVSTTCQEGYERNPETNRCRKIPAVLAASASVGDPNLESQGRLSYVFLSVMSVFVFGYGVYEYRRDVANTIAKIKAKKARKLATK